MTIGRSVLALVLSLSAASAAQAQTPPTTPPQERRFFLHVNGGYQMTSQDVESSSNFEIYDEPASLIGLQSLEGAPIFDASAGYQWSDRIAFAAGLTWFSTDSPITVTARVPHPLFFDQFRTVNVAAEGAKHTTIATNLMAIYRIPFIQKLDFAVSGGPSIIAVKQELVSGITIEPETGPSFSSPVVDEISVIEQRKTAFGFNIGADATYVLTDRYGVGGTVRYIWGKADLDGLDDSLTLGGLQILGGVRIRF